MREKRRYILVEGAEDIKAWVKEHLGLIGLAEADVAFVRPNVIRVRLEALPKVLGVIALHPSARIAKVSGTLKALERGREKGQGE